ncbi:hypothetical protein MCOR27_010900 [Pyricularia oryzae]|uniref:Cellulase n=4 Tax=Pyricularia TaxID=48558 RepID=A0ABQ8N3A9_PYRGI|nr:cellulase [Pyricularia oryzae 70-15]ELQ44392.1 glycosyl hydrolase family 5 protein / cellulase family protein [Pyricularia oryzae Y34]KAH8843410.1 hypothetical protein MCOR01_004223 [Pyricularia oryzae]KAI6290563.1 hypothetical protein MCOR33_011215 [Pyricularia grisea]EHA50849.1 cellulase [Pyricularia oryzae 70-15]KAH9430880.1 hypothetical protein MCOR02_008204 [Pyricularia oryzae]
MAPLTRVCAALLLGFATVATALDAPPLPLKASSRWIVNAENKRVKLKCINWGGHMEVNIPEGLHKQPVDFLAEWVANAGFNCVRLTYSTDMALNPGLMVSDSFRAAAPAAGVSAESMSDMYNTAVSKNPWLESASIIDAHAKVVDALWSKGVMTILDNHVSRASWCCNLDDGNGWWAEAPGYNDNNSRFFKTNEWLAGLQAMASWAQGHKGVVGMGVRNEIREFLTQGTFNGRQDWYDQVSAAARLIHSTHPDVLILIGGTLSSTDLSHVRSRPLDVSEWKEKHVWEWHAYSFTVNFHPIIKTCWYMRQLYGAFDGFLLEQGKSYTGPLILSEFGFDQNSPDNFYLDCLRDYVVGNDGDWAIWALQGSYYARNKQADFDESFGVLNRDWSDWRNSDVKNKLGKMWDTTQGP